MRVFVCPLLCLLACITLAPHLVRADTTSGEPFGVAIDTWYPIETALDSHVPAAKGLRLVSRTSHHCVSTTANTTNSETAVQDGVVVEKGTGLSLACADGATAVSHARHVDWNTMMAPGMYLASAIQAASTGDNDGAQTSDSSVDPLLRCAAYSCEELMSDDEMTLDSNSNDNDVSGSSTDTQALVGGLSPAIPCCSNRRHNTFIIRTAPANVIVQTQHLPFLSLKNASEALVRAAWCNATENDDGAVEAMRTVMDAVPFATPLHTAPSRSAHVNADTTGPKSAVTRSAETCTASAGFCLIRLLDPRFFFAQTVNTSWDGDGGLTFPVNAEICGASISAMYDDQTFQLVTRGLHAVITTTENVDGLGLPQELIRAVLSWIAPFRTDGAKRDGSLDSNQLCHRHVDPTRRTRYRDGAYVSCPIAASAIGNLPPLMLSVPRDRLLTSGLAELQPLVSRCRFALDLNALVDTETRTLRLYSTGSFADAAVSTDAIVRYREPLVVIGALFLRGASLGISRSTRISAVDSGDVRSSLVDAESAWHGLPLLYIAAYAPNSEDDITPSTCAASAESTCIREDRYYASVNRCIAVRCIGILSYTFDSETLTCGPSIVFVALLSFFFVAVVAVEIIFLVVHRRTERAKYNHIDLIEQAQKKKKN